MRRKEREITDGNEIERFLAEQKIMRIAFYDDSDIYVVPVNYGYIKRNGSYTFCFHGAKAGRKYELAKSDPIVGFETDGEYQLISGDIACEYSAYYQSVTGSGRLHLVDDVSEKVLLLNAVMKQAAGKNEWKYAPEMLNAVAVFKLDVNKMSCKANMG